MAVTYLKDKHDVGLLRSDGSTKVGLMLATNKGVPLYETIEDEFLAEQRTETLGYSGLPPEKEIALIGDDHRAGFGLETFDSDDPRRYFSSINMDMRFRGMGICGPKSTAVTIPAGTTSGSIFLRPSGAGNSTTINNETPGSGTHWELVDEVTADDDTTKVQELSGTGLDLYTIPLSGMSGTITEVKVYVRVTGIGDATTKYRIALRTLGTTYYNTSANLPGSWTLASNAWANNPNTSAAWTWSQINDLEIGIELYDNTGGANAECTQVYVKISFSSHGLPSVSFVEYNDELYMGRGIILSKLDADGDEFVAVKSNFASVITDLQSFTDGNLYIAVNGNQYWYMDANETFTESTDEQGWACFFQTVGTTLWKGVLPREIKSATDPTNPASGTNWSSAVTVDSSDNNITDLLSFDNSLYIMKEDRPFYYDGSAIQTLTNITRPIGNSTSGKNVLEWQGKLYMPWGDQGLLERDGSTYTWLDPSTFCTNLGDFVGRVQATGADEKYFFAIVDNSTKVEFIAGRYETIGTTTAWAWHPISEIMIVGCETTFVSNVYQKRLWVASTSTSDSLYYYKLYTGYGDVTNDANKNFQTDGYFITPWLHGDFKGDSKAFVKLTLTMSGTSSTVYFEAHYQKKGDSSWTDIGDFKTSPTTTKYLPVDGSSNKPVSNFIRFKFVAKTGSTASTPVLLGYDCRAVLYPSKRRIIRCVVRSADGIIDKNGQKLDANAALIKTVLEEASNATWPFTFYDIRGDTKTVRLLPMSPFSRVIRKEKGRNVESYYYLNLQEVALS